MLNQPMHNQPIHNQLMHNQSVQDEAQPLSAPTEQLAFDPLPSMKELDALQIDLDQVDRVLADLDNERPVGATPNPSQ